MDFGAVHLDERHQVLVEPVLCEPEVIRGGGEEVDTASAVQVLQSKQILHNERKESRSQWNHQ